MSSRTWKLACLALALVVLVPLAACGATPTPTSVPPTVAPEATTAATTVPPTAVPPTMVPPTPTVGPVTGGKFVRGFSQEPDTLDVQKSLMTAMDHVMINVGSALVSRDPSDGKIVPYLAESWTFSADGLTWTFKLKKGVMFHDGTPLTAGDYAWTFNRGIDPASKAVGTATLLGSLKSAAATDDQTLVLTLKQPYYSLLLALAIPSTCSPLPKAAVEEAGDKWGRAPFGVGPYKFVEWQTGTKITLQRNPDFAWRPQWSKGGPYIDTLEFRIIPDLTTIQAGLETGDLDYSSMMQQKDVERTKATGKVDVFTTLEAGNRVYLTFNMENPILSDLQVRTALAYAINREPIISSVYKGQAVEMYGPISAAVSGYDKVHETYGFKFDVAKAKSVLAAAGWKAGGDGVLVKDDKPLKFTLVSLAGNDTFIQIAQIVQQQWKEIGVQVEIQQVEAASFVSNLMQGKFECSTMGFGTNDFDNIVQIYAGETAGGANLFHLKDASLDPLLSATRSTMDPVKRQEAVNAAVKAMVDNAYLINLAAPQLNLGVSNRVKGVIVSPAIGTAFFLDAYITE